MKQDENWKQHEKWIQKRFKVAANSQNKYDYNSITLCIQLLKKMLL